MTLLGNEVLGSLDFQTPLSSNLEWRTSPYSDQEYVLKKYSHMTDMLLPKFLGCVSPCARHSRIQCSTIMGLRTQTNHNVHATRSINLTLPGSPNSTTQDKLKLDCYSLACSICTHGRFGGVACIYFLDDCIIYIVEQLRSPALGKLSHILENPDSAVPMRPIT